MSLVAFLRGANVGGHKVFRPAVVAAELSAFDVVNVGAAGTFVVRKAVSQATFRAALRRCLPFDTEFMLCRGSEVIDLATAAPFPPHSSREDLRPFVSVLARRPSKLPPLPYTQPDGKDWEVQLLGVQGRFVLSWWRRTARARLYPNEVVEKKLLVAATTRNWDTIGKIHSLLQKG